MPLIPPKPFLSFPTACSVVRAANLKSRDEFRIWRKTSPHRIPALPDEYYKASGWVNYGHFLGTGNVANSQKVFLPIAEVANLAKQAGIKSRLDYHAWSPKPVGVPGCPNKEYRGKGWPGWGPFLGYRTIGNQGLGVLPYKKAGRIARKAGITSAPQYWKWKDRPMGLPSWPPRTYRDRGWVSWGDFLGTGTEYVDPASLLPYNQAAALTRNAQLSNIAAYTAWQPKPPGVPEDPAHAYAGRGWLGWGEYLGTHTLCKIDIEFLPYEEVAAIAKAADITSSAEYHRWNKPPGVPAAPASVYGRTGDWTGWGDFLDTGRTHTPKAFVTYNEASRLARQAGVHSSTEFEKWDRPDGVPSSPPEIYGRTGEWTSWGVFLGRKGNPYCHLKEAKKHVTAAGIRSETQYRNWAKRPAFLPAQPDVVYRRKWPGWASFLSQP